MASDSCLPWNLSSPRRCQIKASMRNQNQPLPHTALTSLSQGLGQPLSLCRTAFPTRPAHVVVEQNWLIGFSVLTATKMELTFPHATQTAIAHMKRFDLGVTLMSAALLHSEEERKWLPSPGVDSEWRKSREQVLPYPCVT